MKNGFSLLGLLAVPSAPTIEAARACGGNGAACRAACD
jgi:hypothetical protein